MNHQQTITLSIWDVLDFKVWDKVCKIKGYSDDFSFAPINETEYEFDLTLDQYNQLGIKRKRNLCSN
ncbi:MAG: hypothetical protein K9J13_02645 [Saprospiraceae bacterium]|nr:hypothetical protein [Saprospiraceae bacterium]